MASVVQQAIALHQQGQLEQAAALYEAALAKNPKEADALLNLSTLRAQQGNPAAAEALLETLTATYPTYAYGHFAHGNVLMQLHRAEDAIAAYGRAMQHDPGNFDYCFNRGAVCASLSRFAEAESAFTAALAIRPGDAGTHNNRGAVRNRLGRYEEALADAEIAIAAAPSLAEAYDTRASAKKGLNRYDAALADYAQALTLNPAMHTAQWNAALLAMLLGDLATGLPLYESRWQTELQKRFVRHFPFPLWLGEAPLAGKTLFIYPEQGLGDFIQCARFFPLLVAQGARLVVEAPPPLAALMASSFAHLPAIRITVTGDAVPACDYHCPIMSLMLALRITTASIPAAVPYLSVDEKTIARWRERLGEKTRPRIGLVWSGGTTHLNDARRSIPLSAFAPLRALPFEFHSLQKEIRESDVAATAGLVLHHEALADFTDTAALILAMDHVVTVDTSVAHLVGALGRPFSLLIPHTPDYRWMLARADSPWYPTARLFRQPEAGDWASVLRDVTAALTALA